MKLDRRSVVCSLAVLCALVVAPTAVGAQPFVASPLAGASRPGATVCIAPDTVSAQDLSSFLARPDDLLQVTDSIEIMNKVRVMAATSLGTVEPILDLAKKATPQQLADIGAGLARAVNACSGPNPQMAAEIEKLVALKASREPHYSILVSAFSKALNGFATAALGRQVGGGGSSAPQISNNGAIGRTGPGSDDGLPTSSETTPGVLRLSRVFNVQSVSPTVPSGR